MEKYNCEKICEIGVQEGVNFNLMIEHNPKEAIAIDPWIDDGIISLYNQEMLDGQYEKMEKLSRENSAVRVIRDYSYNVVQTFPDDYFDFVYIDGDHRYESVIKDIRDWYPKVKKGGFLVGDDYRNRVIRVQKINFGVIQAVDEFSSEKGLIVSKLRRFNWAIVKP